MNKLIYLDNAATTRVLPDISAAMSPYSEELFGNPASAYTFSGNINCKVDEARRVIADFIGAGPKEIFFTGGGSESDN